jgi:MipA family protein
MRFLLTALLLFNVLYAQEQKVTIGVGPYIQTQPYKDTGPILVPSPVVFFDNSLFYVRWSRTGVYFLGDKEDEYAWGLSLTAQPRPYGYKASDSDYLRGMDTRENTIEGGLAFSGSYKDTYLEVMALTDLLDRHDSWLVKAELGDKYKLGNFTFYPSLILIYQSDKFVDYYYGIKESEVATSIYIQAYKPKGGFQPGVQTYIDYPLDESWSAFVNVRVDKITNEAANSPLVNDDYIYSGLVSLIYTFEY